MNNKNGFTLVELLVVIIMIVILAMIAVPMMSRHMARAKKAEAAMILGIIRMAERDYYAEYDAYHNVDAATRADDLRAIRLHTRDLDGAYFSNACYTVTVNPADPLTRFVVICNPSLSGPPAAKANEITSLGLINMDENGDISGDWP